MTWKEILVQLHTSAGDSDGILKPEVDALRCGFQWSPCGRRGLEVRWLGLLPFPWNRPQLRFSRSTDRGQTEARHHCPLCPLWQWMWFISAALIYHHGLRSIGLGESLFGFILISLTLDKDKVGLWNCWDPGSGLRMQAVSAGPLGLIKLNKCIWLVALNIKVGTRITEHTHTTYTHRVILEFQSESFCVFGAFVWFRFMYVHSNLGSNYPAWPTNEEKSSLEASVS